MSALTAKRVMDVTFECLYGDEDPMNDEGEYLINPKYIEGIVYNYAFHPVRIAEHKEQIREMLAELPDEFHANGGGGGSFLNACMDRHGNHWAEHPTMGFLFALGEAADLARPLVPRKYWNKMPGSMPYYVIDV